MTVVVVGFGFSVWEGAFGVVLNLEILFFVWGERASGERRVKEV